MSIYAGRPSMAPNNTSSIYKDDILSTSSCSLTGIGKLTEHNNPHLGISWRILQHGVITRYLLVIVDVGL